MAKIVTKFEGLVADLKAAQKWEEAGEKAVARSLRRAAKAQATTLIVEALKAQGHSWDEIALICPIAGMRL